MSSEKVIIVKLSEAAAQDVDRIVDGLCDVLGAPFLGIESNGDLRFEDASDDEMKASLNIVGVLKAGRYGAKNGRRLQAWDFVPVDKMAASKDTDHYEAEPGESLSKSLYTIRRMMKASGRPVLSLINETLFTALPSMDSAPNILEAYREVERTGRDTQISTIRSAARSKGQTVGKGAGIVAGFVRELNGRQFAGPTVLAYVHGTRFWLTPAEGTEAAVFRFAQAQAQAVDEGDRQLTTDGYITITDYDDEMSAAETVHRAYHWMQHFQVGAKVTYRDLTLEFEAGRRYDSMVNEFDQEFAKMVEEMLDNSV